MATAIPYPASQATDDSPDLFDLRSITSIVRRRLWIFLGIAAVVTALALAFAITQPNRYTATASVLLDRQKTEVTTSEAVLSDLPADSASVDTEVQVLRSPTLLRQVVERLKLTQDPEFNGSLARSSLMARVRTVFQDSAESLGAQQQDIADRVVGSLIGTLEISRRGLTYVIGVDVTTLDPDKSARIANAITQIYIENQVNAKRRAATDAQKFLQSRLSGLGSEVQGKEATAQTLRAQAGLPQGVNQETYDQQVIQDTSRQLIELDSELAEKRGQLAVAESARNNPAALPAVLESAVIRDLKSRRAELLARSADVSNRYGPLHPETRRIQQELRGLDAEIAREMTSIISSLRQLVGVASQRAASVRGQLSGQRGSAIANSRNTARVQQIDREALASRGVYEDFLKRSKETTASEDLARPDATVISRAAPPSDPSQPNRPLLLAAGLAAAFALGLVGIIIAELIDIKISSGADIERYLGLRRLVSVPDLDPPSGRDSHALLVTERPMSSYAEAYRDLSDLVAQRAAAGKVAGAAPGAHVIMISSAIPHEGKTAVASSLSLSLAATQARVLLIDADLRRPQVLAALQVAPPVSAPPIDMVLSGQAPLESATVDFGTPPLRILPFAGENANLEVFRGELLGQFLARTRSHFDYIVIDTPPILALSDGRHISHLADEVILVTRWRRTSRFAAKAAAQALAQSNAPVSGVVLNAVNLKKQSLYARDDSLAFYGSYRNYYTD